MIGATSYGEQAVKVVLRVTSVRSRRNGGGVIFAGKTDAGAAYVVVAGYQLVPDSSVVGKGQFWAVEGGVSEREVEVNGYRLREQQIDAVAATLDRPDGKNLIHWIAESPECVGVGEVKARKLYHRFGTGLIQHIEDRDVSLLAEVVGSISADAICTAFERHGVAQTLLWLDQMGIPRRIGAAVSEFYRDEAKAKVEANPYVLISFEARWDVVDGIARQKFGVAEDDVRRLEAAIEEALYRGLDKGHTYLPTSEVRERLDTLLGSSNLVDQALRTCQSSNQFRSADDGYQTAGAFLIEQYLAERLLAMRAGRDTEGQGEMFCAPDVDAAAVGVVLNAFENVNNIPLSVEQREAVRVSASSKVSLILGGAGTGKTTVLKALYEALESVQPGLVIYQLALAGLAAQRMTEATGRDSRTIAAFLLDQEVVSGSVVVVDEMSMVDVILMYRLLRHVPQGVRLVLVGDPSQLPPIGPGLVLHALAGNTAIPQVELTAVHRQTSASGIPLVADAIRKHAEPAWAQYAKGATGVSFVECDERTLDATVERIYLESGGTGADSSVQILSRTKNGSGGVKGINEALHNRFYGNAQPVHVVNAEFGIVNESTEDGTSLTVGDPVIYTRNDYKLGLRNGSLGRIVLALEPSDSRSICCEAEFDGRRVPLTGQQLQPLRHAFAITVHKSQGSQFTRVIVPVRRSKRLDQALLYTAVTRGVDQVIFVGDRGAAVAAIKAPAFAARRHTRLCSALSQVLASMST